MPTPTVIAPRSTSFQRPFRPRERRCVTLMKSSAKPIAPQARVTKRTVSAGTVYLERARNAAVATPSIRSPPMIGVPCLVTWCSGPSSRIVWPYSLRRRNAMKRGPARIEISIAARPAIRTRTTLGGHRRQRLGDRFQPQRAGAFDEHAVAGLKLVAERLGGLSGVADDVSAVHARLGADRDQHIDADLPDRVGDLPVRSLAVIAELGHLPEDGDASPAAGAIGEMLECCSHRDRVRVPGVVDEEPSARERDFLVPPFRERRLDPLGKLESERARIRKRGNRIEREMPCRKADLERPERRHEARRLERLEANVLTDARQLEVLALDVEARGDNRDAARWQRCDQLRLRLHHALERADLLQVHGSDGGHDADVGPRVPRQLGDLAEAAHRELDDAQLRFGLEPAESERHAELVVVTPLSGDCSELRRAEPGEDVLRRRLAYRARDRDHACGRAVADRLPQRRQRRERFGGDGGRGGPPPPP